MDGSAIVAVWVLCGLLGWLVGNSKGKGGLGLVLGLLLGIFGLIIILVVSPADDHRRTPCPHCAEQIMPSAVVCPNCGRDVEPLTLPTPAAGTGEGWLADPSGRHPDRYWDGTEWTKWVRDKPGGTRSADPPMMRI